MKLPVVWSQEAGDDVRDIITYIVQHNQKAAERMWALILNSVEHLPDYPCLFKSSERIPECREIVVHPNYIVVYRVCTDCIEVLRVLHARQNFPK